MMQIEDMRVSTEGHQVRSPLLSLLLFIVAIESLGIHSLHVALKAQAPPSGRWSKSWVDQPAAAAVGRIAGVASVLVAVAVGEGEAVVAVAAAAAAAEGRFVAWGFEAVGAAFVHQAFQRCQVARGCHS
eukprot:747673-Hanusia_phi.AAC.7